MSTQSELPIREYTGDEIEAFLRDDQLDDEAQQISDRFAVKHATLPG
jgi:hypothetical protein